MRDLAAIFDYWARRAGLEVADRLIDTFEDRMALLCEMPQIGRKCEELSPGVRCFPAGRYLIYYRTARGTLLIFHIFHAAR